MTITIDEAIKQLTLWAQHPPGVVFSSELPAIKLLIEAGKEIEHLRSIAHNYRIPLLPGETNE